jgi:asparagine synthase (glutamine-hydrolysing)
MYRYLAVVWNPLSVEGTRAPESLNLVKSKPAQWSVAYEGPGILAMQAERGANAAKIYPLKRRGGAILGRLFDRQRSASSRPIDVSFGDSEAEAVVSSGGQRLVDRYWGSYFAVIYDEAANRHHVFRDPIGTLPCYHLKHAGADIFFSHIEDCVRLLPISLSISRRFLTNWLFYQTVPSDETGLENVRQLPRGERLTLSQTNAVYSRVWDPTRFAADASFHQPGEAAHALRVTVQDAVDAWASCYRRITHKLSGGLDSAIVAGCLAHSPSKPQITYFNMSADMGPGEQRYHFPGVDPATAAKLRAMLGNGDEKYFARLVAERWNTPLIEGRRDPAMDLTRLDRAPPTAAPAMYFTSLEIDDAQLELIANQGTEAFFSGQAGDSVLLATVQPLPAMDHAYLHGITGDLWRQIETSAALSKESLWSVARKTLKHGLFHRPYTGPLHVLDRPTMLNQELVRTLRQEELESSLARLAAASSLPPGKRNHIQGVVCGYYDFVFHSGNSADHIDPLNSQPVWELMLQIPTYTVLTGGVSRGLARQAFADVLPGEIRKRQTKGNGMPFYQHVVRRNRSYLRDRLADGVLVSQGFLNRRKLMDCLAMDEPGVVIPAATLLAYLAAEIWLQRWSTRPQDISSQSQTTLRKAAL